MTDPTYRLMAKTGHLLVSPLGTMHRAREFFEASEFLFAKSDRFSPVGGFLICRAAELSLKAFLRARGVSRKSIRHLGHDLEKLLTECREYGIADFISLSERERGLLISVSSDYARQKWAYFDTDWAFTSGVAPKANDLAAVVGRLVEILERIIGEAVTQGNGELPGLPLSECD